VNRLRWRPWVVLGCAGLGFLAAIVLLGRPAVPPDRLPRRFVLANLIDKQQQQETLLRRQADQLRRQIEALQSGIAGQTNGSAARATALREADLIAGLTAVRGPGVRVVLDDSNLPRAPSGNLNDLVIHSQDVQAVVNALWRSGAEAVAINGERLVSTSAVLCVGNTLLLNGTVHSTPFEVDALGAQAGRFDADPLVRRLHSDASNFGLRFSVDSVGSLDVPAYSGLASLQFARPRTG
jgi:uncharacterized protein YlxW (UPF0749 family)